MTIIAICFLAACVDHQFPTFVNCDASSLTINILNIDPASACGMADGSVRLSGNGGEKPYLFSLDALTWTNDSLFHELSSGEYSFFIKDAHGCIQHTDSVVATTDPMIVFGVTTTSDKQCIQGDGVIEVSVEGNGNSFEYRLDDGEFLSNAVFEEVQAGDHILYVKKMPQGCITISTVNVPRAFTGISWTTDILPIIIKSCATSGCHDGISRLDWRDYNETKQFAQAIKQRTQNKSMPMDKTLPQEDIDKIACWVDDGALDN